MNDSDIRTLVIQQLQQFKEDISDLIQFQRIMIENWNNEKDIENIINESLLTPEIKQTYLQNKLLFTEFLHTIRRFIDTRPDSFLFVERLLRTIISEIRATFLSNELYSIFFWNRNVLLFLYENGCITIESLEQFSDFFKFYYFYPEFYSSDVDFFERTSKLYQSLMRQYSTASSKHLYETTEDKLELFRKRRSANHSDEKIAKIVRDDDFESFQKYVSSTNANPSKLRLKKSAFESNTLLFFEPTIFEYSCLFQSINIFRLIFLKNVEIIKNLPKYAIAGGSYEIIHLLESKNADFDDECLLTAIAYHRNDIAEYLIESYQLLNQTANEKILRACIQSYNFSFLLNHIENNSSIQPCMIDFILNEACLNGVFDLVNFSLAFPNVDINKVNGRSGIFCFCVFMFCFSVNYAPLHCAVIGGNNELVKFLLKKFDGVIDVNIEGDNDETPLQLASTYGNAVAVDILVNQKDININKKNINGVKKKTFFFNQIPLHYACYGGHSNVVEILVKQANLKVNKKDQNGALNEFLNETPLHRACESGFVKIVELLLSHPNIDVNSLDDDEVLL